MIQEEHLNKYVKGDSSNPTDKYNPHRQEGAKSPRPNKAMEASQGEGNKAASDTLNTIIGGFSKGGETSYVHKRYAHQVMSLVSPQKILERIARSKYNRVATEFYLF